MNVAHATWGADQRLHVWAEDAESSLAADPAPDGSSASGGRRHPFAATAFELPTTGREAWPIETSGAGIVLELPTVRGRPLPSFSPAPDTGGASAAVAPSGGHDVRWEPWRVPTAAQDASGILQLLPAISEGPDGSIGGSLRFFARATLLAIELVARGRFLPPRDRPGGCSTRAPGQAGRRERVAGGDPAPEGRPGVAADLGCACPPSGAVAPATIGRP